DPPDFYSYFRYRVEQSNGAYYHQINEIELFGTPQDDFATYDAGLGAPRFSSGGQTCDSGSLLERSGAMSPPESNAPNTVGGAVDGSGKSSYLSDESIERIVVTGGLHPGSTVRIDVTFNAFGDGSEDFVVLQHTASGGDPSSPLNTVAILQPTRGGLQTMSVDYVLPAGSLQRVRATIDYFPDTCGAPEFCIDELVYWDNDDLVFATSDDVMFDGSDGVVLGETTSGQGNLEESFDCPEGTAVSALDVLADNFNVMGVRFSCATLYPSGEIGPSTAQSGLGMGYPDSFGRPYSSPSTDTRLPCPGGVVTGIRGTHFYGLRQLGHLCSDPSEIFDGTYAASVGEPSGPSGGGSYFEKQCPAGYAMTGADVQLFDFTGISWIVDLKAKCTRVVQAGGTADDDADGIVNVMDNCVDVANPGQHDVDGDLSGDLCDADADGDGRNLGVDNCPYAANVSQSDSDGDGAGDACAPGAEEPYSLYDVGSNREHLLYRLSSPNNPNTLARGGTIGFEGGRYVGGFELRNRLFSAFDRSETSDGQIPIYEVYPYYTFTPFSQIELVDGVQLRLAPGGLFVDSSDGSASRKIADFPELGPTIDSLMFLLDDDGLFKTIAIHRAADGTTTAEIIWQTTAAGKHIQPGAALGTQNALFQYVLGQANPVVASPQTFINQEDGSELADTDLPTSEWDEISDLVHFFLLEGEGDNLVTVVESLCPGLLDGLPVDLDACPLAQSYTQLVSVESAVADYVRVGLIGGSLTIPALQCLDADGSLEGCEVPPSDTPSFDDGTLPSTVLISPAGEHPEALPGILGAAPDVGIVGRVTCADGSCPAAVPGNGPALQNGAFYFIAEDDALGDFDYWAVPLNDRACLRDRAADDVDKCSVVSHSGGSDDRVTISALAPALEPTGSAELILLNKCRKVLNIEDILASTLSDEDLALQDFTFLEWECSLEPDGLQELANAQADRTYLFMNKAVLEVLQMEAMVLVLTLAPEALATMGWETAALEQGASLFFGAQALTSIASHAVEMVETCPSFSEIRLGQADAVAYGECVLDAMHVYFDAEMIAGAYGTSVSVGDKLARPKNMFKREFELKSKVKEGTAESSMEELVSEVGDIKDIDAKEASGLCPL
ncbi:MAG: thrombospondin type 3 repeat-containing protein, partial [Acidobacteriota bacterium]